MVHMCNSDMMCWRSAGEKEREREKKALFLSSVIFITGHPCDSRRGERIKNVISDYRTLQLFFSSVSVCVKSSSGRTDGTQCTDYKRRKV